MALRNVLINRFPILLIDESQDTNKYLMDALLEVQNRNPSHLLPSVYSRDTMQRIYADGKGRFGTCDTNYMVTTSKANEPQGALSG